MTPINVPPTSFLIIDDSETDRETVSLLLKRISPFAKIVSVENVGQAMSLLQSSLFDCVIVDQMIPNRLQGDSGVFVLKKEYPNTKILAMSSSKHPDVRNAALAAGADGFISKEPELDTFMDRIKEFIDPPFAVNS